MAPVANPVTFVGDFSKSGVECCPPGTRCIGICINTPIGSICAGSCRQIDAPGNGVCPPGLESCVTPFGVECVAPGTCLGPPVGPPEPPPQNGCPEGTVRVPITGQCLPIGNGGGRGGCKTGATGTQQRILCPPGCHANKSDYFVKGGTFVPAGTKCVTNRRRNPLNPRALDRAAGRLRSAQKVVRFLQTAKIPKRRRR